MFGRENGRFRNSNRSVGNFVQDVGVEEVVLDSFNRGHRGSARKLFIGRTVHMPQGCRRSFSQNTYKEKYCIVSIPFHPSSDPRNKRLTLKSSVSLLGSLVRQRKFPSNNNYVDRWDNFHKRRHLQNPQRTLLCG